jgi:hypothetical protein
VEVLSKNINRILKHVGDISTLRHGEINKSVNLDMGNPNTEFWISWSRGLKDKKKVRRSCQLVE